jgi:diguanylate cyclase (GGDEF)-like protein/PAS domain S-box-containing protein
MFERVDEDGLLCGREVDRLTSPWDIVHLAAEQTDTSSKIESSRPGLIAAPIAAILDALQQMVRISDPSGHLEYRNTRFYDFTGAIPGEVEAEDWKKVVHPDDVNRAWTEWCRCLQTGEPYETSYRIRHHSGEYRWILACATPYHDEQGRIVRWFGTSTEIDKQKQSEDALRTSEERLRLALQTTGLGIWDADLVTGKREWTQEAKDILGLAPEAPTARDTFLDRIHPDDRDRIGAKFFAPDPERILSYDDECRIVRADNGQERWVAITGRTLLDEVGRPVRKLGTIQDITDRKSSQAALEASEERLRVALRAARMFAWEEDPETKYITRSEHAMSLLGVGSGPLEEFMERVPAEDRERRRGFISEAGNHGSGTMEFRYMLPSGDTIWLASRAERATSGRIVGVTYDISDRKAAEEEVWRAANHDALTGLPNRALFQRILDRELEAAKSAFGSLNLLVVDLDDFKDVNDSLGHAAGDALLKEAADRLVSIVAGRDMVARLGGDEFAVLLPNREGLSGAAHVADTIVRRFRQPFAYEGRAISSRASIGLASCPEHDCEPAALMKDADIALYQAKTGGRNRVVVYNPEMRALNERRLSILREVRSAVARDEFAPYYQPKICLSTGRIVGLEALTRWHHPDRGVLAPLEFDVAFDDPELAGVMGKRLVGRVAADLRRWLNAGLDPGRVAINLSSAEFTEPTMADEILRLLDLAKIPTSHFEVEVTERVLLDGRCGPVIEALEKYRQRGVQIALDDFGTGYASLTHLKQFPVDHIKIDQSFVQGIDEDPTNKAIVAAVIGLGQAIGLQVTAEGVETESQAQRLREMGCHNAQGYLYARPMPAHEATRFLGSR